MKQFDWQDVVGWAWGLGYRIALPLVAFGLIGRLADRRYETEYLFFLAGLLFALITSGLLVYHQIRSFIK